MTKTRTMTTMTAVRTAKTKTNERRQMETSQMADDPPGHGALKEEWRRQPLLGRRQLAKTAAEAAEAAEAAHLLSPAQMTTLSIGLKERLTDGCG